MFDLSYPGLLAALVTEGEYTEASTLVMGGLLAGLIGVHGTLWLATAGASLGAVWLWPVMRATPVPVAAGAGGERG